MEFWGVEVKPGQTLKCEPGEDKFLHLSQSSLGEIKKDKASENVPVFVKFNDQKIVIGTLSGDKFPQVAHDIVFEKEFELSHSSKSTSVYFCGYKSHASGDYNSEDFSDSESEDEAIEPAQKANGKPEVVKAVKISGKEILVGKAEAPAAKPKVKADKPKPDEDEDDDDEDDDSEEDDSDSGDEDMPEAGGDSDEDDSSDEEADVTPKKAEPASKSGKKRAADSASKTPVPEKKAKLVSPAGGQKSGGDGKKGVHIATPHPAKQAGKTPASNKQSPKSGGGSVSCKSCSKTFNSENALQAHSKAKHETAK